MKSKDTNIKQKPGESSGCHQIDTQVNQPVWRCIGHDPTMWGWGILNGYYLLEVKAHIWRLKRRLKVINCKYFKQSGNVMGSCKHPEATSACLYRFIDECNMSKRKYKLRSA